MRSALIMNSAPSPLTPTSDLHIVLDLIATSAAASARFERAAPATDEVRAAQEGRNVTQADRAEYEAADAADHAAYRALLSFPSRDHLALRLKAQFIQLRINMGERLQEDEVDLLLGSMIETRAQRAAS